MKNKVLKAYHKATKDLTDLFVTSYFFGYDKSDYYWVADDVGGVLHCGDYFFDMETIKKCIELDMIQDEVFLWIDYDISEWLDLWNECNGENPTKEQVKAMNAKFGIDCDNKLNIENFVKFKRVNN